MEDRKYTGGRRRAGWSMHLSSRGEFGQDPTRAAWPKGLRGPPLPLLPLRIEVGWIRLASSDKKKPKCKNLRIKAKTNLIWISSVKRCQDVPTTRGRKPFVSGGRRVCRGGTGPLPAPERGRGQISPDDFLCRPDCPMLLSSWRRACRGSPEVVVGVEEEEQKGKDARC